MTDILTLRHPKYNDYLSLWTFYNDSYIGGETYFKTHLTQYYKEGDISYQNRLKRAYRENYCKAVIDIVNSYLFKETPTRHLGDEALEKFFNNVDGHGKDMTQFMKSASIVSSIFGRAYIVTDKTKLPEEKKTGTKLDNFGVSVYSYIVNPMSVKDVSFDEFGKVRWILIEEIVRDDGDPFTSSMDLLTRYRLWTKTGWKLYGDKGETIEEGTYDFGYPPITYIDTGEKLDPYTGMSLISDIAYMDKAIFNNLSRLDNIISDQTFSQLIFPIEGVIVEEILNDDRLKEQWMKMSIGSVLFYSAQAEAKPEYISPDASQAEVILMTIKHQIRQIYSSIGLQPPDTESSSPESGVSKQYDFDKLNKLLAGKADNIELAERQIIQIYNDWMDKDFDATINYPDEFDIRSLADEIILGQELMLLDISETFNKTVQKNITMKALPKEGKDLIEKILKEIEEKVMPSPEDEMDFDEKHKENSDKVHKTTQTKYRIQKNLS
jgi:mRNA-degrading endonuclease RelE of RelBE toxin-antitoxin system